MGLQFSIFGRCNVSFEQVESAASRKAAVDTQNVEFYTRIHNKLRLWDGQLERGNYAHFPTLQENKPTSTTPFV